MVDPHRLRVFRSVMASGSLQAAADNLGMTASAVSQHLSALARETGLTLFERSGRSLAPTPAATYLHSRSDDLIAELERLDDVITDLREGRRGRLSIGYFSSAGLAWMPTLAKELSERLPEVTLELILTEGSVRSTHPDIDLVIDTPDSPVRTGYRRIELITDPFVAVVPADHPLAGAGPIDLRELRGQTWISNDDVRSPGHRLVVSACTAAGFTPRFTVQAQDQYTAMAFVAAGIGVTVLPRLAASPLPSAVRRVALGEDAPVRHLSAHVRVAPVPHPSVHLAIEILTRLIHPARGPRRR